MRPPVDEPRIREPARELSRVTRVPVRVYLTGGSTAVLEGWRASQALAKIERGFEQDLDDVRNMIANGLVQPARLRELHGAIEPDLYRYPAIDPTAFRRKLDELLG